MKLIKPFKTRLSPPGLLIEEFPLSPEWEVHIKTALPPNSSDT